MQIFRNELKYFIHEQDYLALRQRLKQVLNPDGHSDANGEYHVRSLYFDDPYNRCFFEKSDGIKSRRKYRLRIYNFSDQVIKLECKYKEDRFIAKEAVRISREEYESILSGQNFFPKKSNHRLLNELYVNIRHNLFKPVVVVDYIREAYIAGYQHIRINFDKHLKTEMNSIDLFDANRPAIRPLEPSIFILEVKYLKFLPGYLKLILQFANNCQRSISKYAICRAEA